jgi:hypothetical protein
MDHLSGIIGGEENDEIDDAERQKIETSGSTEP